MERLTINIPESKSVEIKEFLKKMGVLMDDHKKLDLDAYRKKISGIGKWSEEDIRLFEENRQVTDHFKPLEW